MKADEVLKLRGRGREHASAPGEWLETKKRAAWHYADMDLVLEHDGTCYRVKEIVRKDD